MTAPQKRHPDVTALAPRFIAYMDRRKDYGWGPLFGPLMHHPEFGIEGYRPNAESMHGDDTDGMALFEICGELTETQRRKLANILLRAQQTRVTRSQEQRRQREDR